MSELDNQIARRLALLQVRTITLNNWITAGQLISRSQLFQTSEKPNQLGIFWRNGVYAQLYRTLHDDKFGYIVWLGEKYTRRDQLAREESFLFRPMVVNAMTEILRGTIDTDARKIDWSSDPLAIPDKW